MTNNAQKIEVLNAKLNELVEINSSTLITIRYLLKNINIGAEGKIENNDTYQFIGYIVGAINTIPVFHLRFRVVEPILHQLIRMLSTGEKWVTTEKRILTLLLSHKTIFARIQKPFFESLINDSFTHEFNNSLFDCLRDEFICNNFTDEEFNILILHYKRLLIQNEHITPFGLHLIQLPFELTLTYVRKCLPNGRPLVSYAALLLALDKNIFKKHLDSFKELAEKTDEAYVIELIYLMMRKDRIDFENLIILLSNKIADSKNQFIVAEIIRKAYFNKYDNMLNKLYLSSLLNEPNDCIRLGSLELIESIYKERFLDLYIKAGLFYPFDHLSEYGNCDYKMHVTRSFKLIDEYDYSFCFEEILEYFSNEKRKQILKVICLNFAKKDRLNFIVNKALRHKKTGIRNIAVHTLMFINDIEALNILSSHILVEKAAKIRKKIYEFCNSDLRYNEIGTKKATLEDARILIKNSRFDETGDIRELVSYFNGVAYVPFVKLTPLVISESLQYSIGISISNRTDDIKISKSKIKGLPHLPITVEWPEGYFFYVQYNLCDLAKIDALQNLPTEGMLYIFLNASFGCKVIYYDGPLEELRVREYPPELRTHASNIYLQNFINEGSLIEYYPYLIAHCGCEIKDVLDDQLLTRVESILECSVIDEEYDTKMYGEAQYWQGENELSGDQLDMIEKLDAYDSVLLFQDEYDDGTIHFWITKSDLANKIFSNVRVTFSGS